MRRLAPLLLLAAVLGAGPRAAPAEEDVPGAAAERAVEDLLARGGEEAFARAGRARARLLRLGEAGLRAATRRLAESNLDPVARARLLQVVAVAEQAEADGILADAARSPDPALRLMAADGLAWGRTVEAAAVLETLARDPVPAVRIAALRALFALETEPAVAARQALPADERPDLAARRLTWHRKRGHAGPALLPLAEAAWERGRTPEERLEGARLLTEAAVRVPLDRAWEIVEACGTDPFGAAMARIRLGLPEGPYDPHDLRQIAIRAIWVPIFRGEGAVRADAIDRAVGWLAHPASGDVYDERSVPEMVLRMVLPDLGEALVPPTLARLERGGFTDPQDGVFLLTESLPADHAARLLGGLLAAAATDAVRVAAAEGLVVIGRVGERGTAERALDPSEDRAVRRALVRALAGESAPWALDVLARLVEGDDDDLREAAVHALEKREEEAARRLLVAYLFSDAATYRDQRMLHLVEPADDLAFAVLARALDHPKIGLRKAALQHLGHLAVLRTPRARALALDYTQRGGPGRTHPGEWQELLYAWIAQAPDETLRLVEEHWAAYEAQDWGSNAIKTLQNLRGAAVDAAVVDFVLEKVAWDGARPHGPPLLLIHAGTALGGRRGHRDAELDRFWRALLGHPDRSVVLAAVRSLDHDRAPGDLTDVLLPLLARVDVGDPAEVGEAADLLEVLARQPEAKVEDALIALVRDANADPSLRRESARVLVGRLSPAGRNVLLDWLIEGTADASEAYVHRVVARAVGTGGDAAVAERVLAALERRLAALFAEEARLDPDAVVEPQMGEQLGALARTAAFTGDRPALERLARLVFLPEVVPFARRGVARQATRIGPADPSAAARDGPSVLERWHRAGGPYAALPAEIWHVVEAMKVAPDAALAEAFTKALAASPDVALFPDLYFDRIAALLHDKRTGDLEESAAVLEDWAWRAEPVGGAVDFGIAADRARRRAWAGRFEEAVLDQERALGILARRAYDDDPAWSWRNERGTLEALRGAAAAARGEADRARVHFETARAIHPYSARVLRDVAWLRALVDFDLDQALADARRAVALERRQSARGGASAESGDVLALVLLARGEAREAAELLQIVVRYTERRPHLGGRAHLHFAEALLRAGYPVDALAALRGALVMEPTLGDAIRAVEAFGPWMEDGTIDALLADERERFLDRLERD